jgi:hypothetical protein
VFGIVLVKGVDDFGEGFLRGFKGEEEKKS